MVLDRLPSRRARLAGLLVLGTALSVPGVASAHDKFDHPTFGQATALPLGTGLNSGGPGATWELITSVPTGNPHTDVDFFTSGGESFAALGTLGVGANGGGQSIVQLTEAGEVDPAFFSSHPSAFCASNAGNVLGLQHDVEATPKGDVISAQYDSPVTADAQLLLDATDAEGRCHDQGLLGVDGAPRGGLEIIDITDVAAPVEIALTSHIGESHTVNIDPKRPHIAYSVTSDLVSVSEAPDGTLTRDNEDPTSTARFNLDGFEVVDLSSCMTAPFGTLPTGATALQKRDLCRPEVYRYRFPTLDMSLGHTLTSGVYGCHELEIDLQDRLTCGAGAALLVFDMSDAFDAAGKPVGDPLPCRTRPSSTTGPTATAAMVVDCVEGGTEADPVDLSVAGWLAAGAPSLEGVRHLGSVHHQGRGAGAFDSTQDIDFNHEAELSQSGDFVFATDERGGGVTPPGAACDPLDANLEGNGGIHAYQVDELDTVRPTTAEEAFEAYAVDESDGGKAVFRAPVRTQPQATVCTAHVMQQIPDQNRIFMGYYSQGTQVVDYVELPGGVLEFVQDDPAAGTEQAGYFIPENANQWVSHVFKVDENPDGTFTYYGVTGDFFLGAAGRNAIDVYSVTLPPPADACTLADSAEGYTDLGGSRDVHRDDVECVIHYEISQGTSATTYAPTQEVSRAQMASFLVRAVEKAGGGARLPAAPAGDAFVDIAGDTHAADINRLAAAGIVRGRDGVRYDPSAPVTREEMASFIVRTARVATGEAFAAARTDAFGDIPSGSTHDVDIHAGFEAGLFQGFVRPVDGQPDSGRFVPRQTVLRDQMATFLTRLFIRSIQQ